MQRLSDLTGVMPEYRSFDEEPTLPLPTCYIGIEIEAENVTLRERVPFWTETADLSLRNSGREFVSILLRGKDIERALTHLNTHFDKMSSPPEFTERTGVHIHMDVRDMDTTSLKNMIVLYMIFERTLFKFSGPSRENNVYCIPFYKADYPISYIDACFEDGVSGPVFLDSLRNTYKYQALNLLPILLQGSVEFRHLSGTRDATIIKKWISILMELKKYALQEDVTAEKIIKDATFCPLLVFVRDIFPHNYELINALYPHEDDLKNDVLKGAKTASDLVHIKALSPNAEKGKQLFPRREENILLKSSFETYWKGDIEEHEEFLD